MMLHPDSATKDVKSILISCFAAAESAGPSADRTAEERELDAEDPIGPFHPPQFFEAWFRTHGTPLFFLFNKNLKVTNIQFAELLALIRRYVTSSVDATPIEVQFVSPRDFNATVTHIISTFHRDPQHPDHRWKTLADLYADMISRLICVDAFFGSCAVFLPPGLRLSLIDVCFRAGYIHSCGLNVFTRNVYKARKEVFISRVLTHCRKHFTGGNKVLFRVYCHEDFTPYDRPYEKALQAGLDDVKIHLGKTYMGGAALVEVLEELNEKTGGMLIIPAPGDYHRSEKLFDQFPDRLRSRCLFLVVDHGIDSGGRNPSGRHYFICYDQLYVNENPLHLFDENKPGWIDHTTIPHTLIGAMINVTRPYWSRSGKTKICDPFVGTGTTWLECAKDIDEVMPVCQDVSVFAPLMACDNLEFFKAGKAFLMKLKSAVEFSQQVDIHKDEQLTLTFPEGPSSIADLVIKAFELSKETAQQAKVVRSLSECDFLTRFFYYIWKRALVRHGPALKRGAEDLRQAYITEAKIMCQQVEALLSLREREERTVRAEELHEAVSTCAARKLFLGTYTVGYSIDFTYFTADRCNWQDISVRSVEEMASSERFDVIVADPPYGFNTAEDAINLARIYAVFIKRSIECLNSGGQLVISLPDWSHTGRQLPYFALKQIVTQQVLLAADQCRREVLMPATAVPANGSLFRAPYYWESERALRRAILHFRFG